MKRKMTGIVLLMILLILPMLPLSAEEADSVLLTETVESKGRIRGSEWQGTDGFFYDGTDIKKLATDMVTLYKSCQ